MNNIIYLKSPVTINSSIWVMKNAGFVGVGKETSNPTTVELLAYQKANIASLELKEYAKKNNAVLLVGLSNGEINEID